MLGPFPIHKKIYEVAFCFKLLSSIKVHIAFHLFLLECYKESNIFGRMQPPLFCIEIGNHEEYKVEKGLWFLSIGMFCQLP